MSFKLRVSRTAHPGQDVKHLESELYSGIFLIGRRIDHGERVAYDGDIEIGRMGIKLSDSHVSRRHGVFTINGTGISYSDLGSLNGSYLNGELLNPNEAIELHDHDVIGIWEYMIEVLTEETPTRQRPVIS